MRKMVLLFLLATLISGCAANRILRHSDKVLEPRPDPRALDLFIDGVVEDAEGNFGAALLSYHEALLYDWKSPTLFKSIGRNYLWLGKEESAFIMLKRALTLNPRDTEARSLVARIIAQQGRLAAAEKEYKTVISVDSNSIDAYSQLALIYLRSGQSDKAIGMYREIINRSEDFDPRIYTGLADLYLEKKRIPEAEAVYQRLVAADPTGPTGYFGLGTVREAEGDTAGAEVQYRLALEKDPGMDEARDRLGALMSDHKDWQGAVALFREGIAFDSSSVSDWLSLGDTYRQMGDTANAVATYREIQSRFPDNWQAYLNLGRVFMDGQKIPEAFEQFKKVLDLSPRNFWGLLMGGIALVHQDSLERSIPWLEGALEVNPKDPLGNYYLGNALNQLNRAEQAVPHLVAAIQGRPQWVSALSALAGSYESLKQYTLADSFYTAALALDPENALVLNNYGYSLSERGIRLEEAASMARKAIDKDPGNGAYLDTMGWIYYKMGDFGQALSFIEKAYGLRPKSADVVEHLGDVYNKLERRDEAVKYWERALELNPGNAGLLHKLGRPVPEVP